MTSEVADAAVDLLLDHAADDRVSLFFFGGEPLLEQQLMQRATDRARARATGPLGNKAGSG